MTRRSSPPPRLWKHHLKKIFSILYSWPPIKRTLLLGLIYFYIAVVTCVNVCERACLVHGRVCAHAGWVMCNCVCMCLCPQRYFNFFRILNKHAAAASAERCLPVALGLDGWRCWWWGKVGGGLWPWLWGGEAAHGQGPRRTQWRLALEDFWTTTLLQQKACQHWLAAVPRFQPKSLRFPSPSLLLLPLFLSFSLSLSPAPSSLTRLPPSVSSSRWTVSRFVCYFVLSAVLLGAGYFVLCSRCLFTELFKLFATFVSLASSLNKAIIMARPVSQRSTNTLIAFERKEE